MNNKLFDALETCLQALEKGETIDSALARFPALADELRPILEASLHARGMAGEAVAEDIRRRGRAKVMQRAAELREAKRSTRQGAWLFAMRPARQRTWLFAMRPVAVTLMVVVFLLSGNGLVRASSGALPGDNLYPVKRTWEDVTLMFVSGIERDDLELTYETERIEEINELLAAGRDEVVSFSGYINSQTTSEWKVAGVPVLITVDTTLPTEPVNIGQAVMVTGTTNDLGFLVAQSIVPLAPGAVVPEIEVEEHEDSHEDENENDGSQILPGGGESADSSDDDAHGSDGSSIGPEVKLKGVVESASGTMWVINGQTVDVSGAEIEGMPAAGATVTVEGYYNADGVFIATKVVFSDGGGNGSDDSGGSSLNDNHDSNDDDGGEHNDNNDNSSEDNTNNTNEANDNSGED